MKQKEQILPADSCTGQASVLANIASVLGNNGVSIAQVVQKSRKGGVMNW